MGGYVVLCMFCQFWCPLKKKGTSFKLHKRNAKDIDTSMAHQMKYLSPDDIKMLRQGNEMIQKRYLGLNNKKQRTKRIGLATWFLGWGVYSNTRNIMSIK